MEGIGRKGSRGAPVMHMCTHAQKHTLMGVRIFSLDGVNIATKRTTLINWGCGTIDNSGRFH